MTTQITAPGQEAALAEFDALRQEILQSRGHQHSLFVVFLTGTGAIFGFALQQPDRTPVLLVVPFLAYLVSARYVALRQDLARLGTYIRVHLNERLGGGLHWEQWVIDTPAKRRTLGPAALFFSFVGSSGLALAGSAPFILSERDQEMAALWAALWLTGSILTVMSARHLALRMHKML